MKTPGRLAPILEATQQRMEIREAALPRTELERRCGHHPFHRDNFVSALAEPGLSVIAEFKRRSPSAGSLSDADLNQTLDTYERYGANAFSILTDEENFGGSLQDLETAAKRQTPCIRKDFILNEYMMMEARASGASALLLIARLFEPEELKRFTAFTHELGLAVLLEIHDPSELDAAIAAEPDAIGVNARDLSTFEVFPDKVLEVLPMIPSDFLKVAESGIEQASQAQKALDAGADAILVGSALMRAEDPGALLKSLKLQQESA